MAAKDLTASANPVRVTKRRAETRARLLQAAYRVFADQGFGRVRIEEVCTAAGYTRGAFYSQFESLDELFFTLYDEHAQLIAEQLTEALGNPGGDSTPEAAVNRIADTLFLDRDWLLIRSDFQLYAARNPAVAQRLTEHRAQLRNAIEELITASGVQLPQSLRSAAEVARAVVATYDGIATQLLLDDDLTAARAQLRQMLTALV
ncbi:MAG: TetR/AcrR family transcriptional regulator, partial [Actinobacteria bacterium]|nr:TetR/AcrR family transcriptional regulator [Actinomycetota bacterium]